MSKGNLISLLIMRAKLNSLFLYQAYYGGEARCDAELGENFNPEELVCGGCSDIAKAQVSANKN